MNEKVPGDRIRVAVDKINESGGIVGMGVGLFEVFIRGLLPEEIMEVKNIAYEESADAYRLWEAKNPTRRQLDEERKRHPSIH